MWRLFYVIFYFLQKYRSHRKHLLSRESEAASWSQRRQIYGVAAADGEGHGGKRDISPWLTSTMGFPPMIPIHQFRALHVWGHPSLDQSFKHMYPPSRPPLAWLPPVAPPPYPGTALDPSYWHTLHGRVSFQSLKPWANLQINPRLT